MVTAQLQRHIVLGQQHVRDASEQIRLVLRQPEQLRGREARHGRYAGDPAEVGDPLHEHAAFGLRPPVIPKDGRAQRPIRRVEHDGTVHLAGEADRLRGGQRRGCAGAQSRQRLAGGCPPGVGLLLRPERLRAGDRERTSASARRRCSPSTSTALTAEVPMSIPRNGNAAVRYSCCTACLAATRCASMNALACGPSRSCPTTNCARRPASWTAPGRPRRRRRIRRRSGLRSRSSQGCGTPR